MSEEGFKLTDEQLRKIGEIIREQKPKNSTRRINKIPTPLSLTQLRKLFSLIDNTKILLACALAVRTGMRINEILSTRISDIEWQLGRIKKQHGTKGNKPAVFYLDKKFMTILKKYVSLLGDTEFLFPSKQMVGRMSREGFYNEFAKYLKKADLWIIDKNRNGKIKHHVFTFHSFRTTFCSFLINAGVPVFVAKELMRHSKITTTERYYAYLGDLTLKKELDRVFGSNKINSERKHAENTVNSIDEYRENLNGHFNSDLPQREPLHELQLRLVRGEISIKQFRETVEAISSSKPVKNSKIDNRYIG